jgi:hypothetical protein
MKSDYFLAVPVLATVCNVLLAIAVIIHHSHHAIAQPILTDVLIPRGLERSGEECMFDMSEYAAAFDDMHNEAATDDSPVAPFMTSADHPDPMLASMPGTNFMAYKRADISSFYREEPGSRVETTPSYKGQACKFVNMSPFRVSVYWEGPDGPSFNSNLGKSEFIVTA